MPLESAAEKTHCFLNKFSGWLQQLHSRGQGCRHCSHQCLSQFADQLEDLRAWREQWADLRADVQDSHLLWIFFGRGQAIDKTTQLPLPRGVDTESEDDSSGQPMPKRTRILTSSDPSWSSDEELLAQRIPTSSGSGSSSPWDVDSDNDAIAHKPKPRKAYHAGQPRRPILSLQLLGLNVCIAAGRDLLSVGKARLKRVQEGAPDGRRRRKFQPGLKQTSVWRFLWKLYHSVAEGMPDKFNFEQADAQTLVIRASRSLGKRGPKPRLVDKLDLDPIDINLKPGEGEEEARAIAAHAMYLESLRNPADAALVGPGMFRGPLRFLPPGKRVHLFWEFTAWAKHWKMPLASFSTFLRAFGQCDKQLRIRTVGEHAVCDICTCLKKRLRDARWPKDRQAILMEYTSHVLMVWLDRQVYANATTTSLECRRLLEMGERFGAIALSVSQLCMAVDGMDQAKFRVPRILLKTKGLEKLYRPALHIQGAWAHGWGYHLAVMDADMKHDTNNNVDVISRLLDQIYRTHGGLPKGLHLQQDNTCRECKNQKLLKWAIKVIALGVFRWLTLSYLTTGHTHEDLDATFGQLTVKLALTEFDDDVDVVERLMRLLGGLGIDAESRRSSVAYKLDEAPEWEHWWDEVSLQMSNLTGPTAPHVFRVCLRRDLGSGTEAAAERGVVVQPLPGLRPHGDDVVIVIKAFMSSPQVHQVITALPFHGRPGLSLQPAGLHGRRLGDDKVKGIVARRAEEAFAQRQVSAKARDYLVQWATGVRRRLPKPEAYAFLSHRWSVSEGGSALPLAYRRGVHPVSVVRIQALGHGGAPAGPLPRNIESDDDADQGPLILAA